MVFLGGMVSQGLKDQLDPLDLKDPLVLPVEGPSTRGGERALVHKYRAPSYCTPASLEDLGTTTLEVEPTTCACLRTQSTAQPSHIEMEFKDIPMSMVQSMKPQISTMYLVLCATCLLDQLQS